jgi:hypothetical protein
MKKIFSNGWVISFLFFMPLLLWGTVRVERAINFSNQCGGYMQQVSCASSPEIAQEPMKKTLSYMEKHNLTKGCVCLFGLGKTPTKDVGFWYANMKSVQTILDIIVEQKSSTAEKSSTLLKIKQCMVDRNEEAKAPLGITVYPHNNLFFLWGLLGLLFAAGRAVVLLKDI